MSDAGMLQTTNSTRHATPAEPHSLAVQVRRFRSADQLRAHADTWNRLWEASTTSIPSLRAEAIATWCDTFAGPDSLDACLVEVGGRPAAALPLVKQCLKRVCATRQLPTNPYLAYGDPLVDGGLADPLPVLQTLLKHVVAERPAPTLLWLEQAFLGRPSWLELVDAASRLGMRVLTKPHHGVGQTLLADSWDAFERAMRKKDRQNLRRHRRRIEEAVGPLTLEMTTRSDGRPIRDAVQEVFDVEAHSWKAAAGTAVVQDPIALGYFGKLAEALAESGHLSLCMLRAGDVPIAASYGFAAKGTYYLVKLGCDDMYRKWGPGQLLIYLLVQALHERDDVREISFFGEMADYQKCWVNQIETVGRVVIARRGPKAVTVFGLYKHGLPALKVVGRSMHRAACRCRFWRK